MYRNLRIMSGRPQKRVLEEMERQGLTQRDLVARTGKSQSYISAVLNGRTPGSMKLWLMISQALGVNVEELQADAETGTPDFRPGKMDPRLREVIDFLVAKWPELDTDQRGEVRMTLRRILPGFEEWLKERKA